MDHREHSVYFDDYNSWDIWHLVPSARPTPSIPEVRTNFVTIPGRSGSLDLTEALTGGIVYEDRELEIEFIVLDQEMYWMDIYQDVVSKIHGKKMKIRLVDDPEYYYIGRVTVGEFASNSDYSSISVTCQLEPYKYGDFFLTDTAKIYIGDLAPVTVDGISMLQTTLTFGKYSHEGIGSPWNIPIAVQDTGSIFFTKESPVHNRNSIIYYPEVTFMSTNPTAIGYADLWNNYTPIGVTPIDGGKIYSGQTKNGMAYTNPTGEWNNYTTLRLPATNLTNWDVQNDYVTFTYKWQERSL